MPEFGKLTSKPLSSFVGYFYVFSYRLNYRNEIEGLHLALLFKRAVPLGELECDISDAE